MTQYIKVKSTNIRQKERLKKTFESKCIIVAIRLNFEDLDGEDFITVTKSQCTKMAKAYEGNKGLTI